MHKCEAHCEVAQTHVAFFLLHMPPLLPELATAVREQDKSGINRSICVDTSIKVDRTDRCASVICAQSSELASEPAAHTLLLVQDRMDGHQDPQQGSTYMGQCEADEQHT
jgi:hypothetical protein